MLGSIVSASLGAALVLSDSVADVAALDFFLPRFAHLLLATGGNVAAGCIAAATVAVAAGSGEAPAG